MSDHVITQGSGFILTVVIDLSTNETKLSMINMNHVMSINESGICTDEDDDIFELVLVGGQKKYVIASALIEALGVNSDISNGLKAMLREEE
jgi:hypothetical protein